MVASLARMGFPCLLSFFHFTHLPNVFSKTQQRLALNQLQPNCASILTCCTMQASALTALCSKSISVY